jgi:apolipoprotein N-acyltransferase
MRLLLGSVAGVLFGAGTVGLWLFPAARAHLAAGVPSAAALTLAAAWLYGGMYVAALALIHGWLPEPRWLATAVVWVLLEWVRGLVAGGAPWALLGHSQHDAAVAQIAELGGVPAVSFLVMLASSALAERGRARRIGLVVAGCLAAGSFAFGRARLADLPVDGAVPEAVAAASARPVGGGVPVTVVALSGRHLAPDPVRAYVEATAAAVGAPAGIVVWPEGATPGYLDEEPEVRAAIAHAATGHAGLVTGARRYLGAGAARRYFNSVFAVAPPAGGGFVADKQRLVPLAERSPWPAVYDLPQPFSPGSEPLAPIALAGLRLGPLVCWDVLFDDLVRDLVRRGADLLLNLSSDRDLGAGAGQLVVFARFRAIETRRTLLRASGVGRSLVIDPAGRLLERDRVRLVPGEDRPLTFWVRHGHLAPGVAALALAVILAAQVRRRRGSGRER